MLTYRILILALWTGSLVVNGHETVVSYTGEAEEHPDQPPTMTADRKGDIDMVSTIDKVNDRTMKVAVDYTNKLVAMKPIGGGPCMVIQGLPKQMESVTDKEKSDETATLAAMIDIELTVRPVTKSEENQMRNKLTDEIKTMCGVSNQPEINKIVVVKTITDPSVDRITGLKWWPWWGWWYWRRCYYCHYYYHWPCYRWPYWFYYWRYRFVIMW